MKFTAWEVAQTDKAILIANSHDTLRPVKIWVPRSQIDYILRFAPTEEKGKRVHIDVKEWLVEQKEEFDSFTEGFKHT